MNRVRAGYYKLASFYAWKDEAGFWSVGETIDDQNYHLEDFSLLRDARNFILKKLGGDDERIF
jgi:hypothetical protein